MTEHMLDKSDMVANIRTLRMAGFKFERHALDTSISNIDQLWHYYDKGRCIATLVLFIDRRTMCWWRSYPDLPMPVLSSQ